MFRFVVVFGWIAIISLVFYPLALITCFIPITKRTIPHVLARWWAKSILWVSGVKVSIIGLENIDPNKPYLFVANHQSQYDIFTILAHLPVQFKWMAKKSLFYIPLVGWGMKACGYISVDRKRPKAAYKALLKALAFLKEGYSIVIFPEGTRSLNGKISTFKSGGIMLALRTDVAIVPLAIINTINILPKGGRRIQPGKVTIVIDRPIELRSYNERDKNRVANFVREVIVKNYEKFRDIGPR
jgi:1-acyl-sn-glycerol-3-phosphate acyltransferase